MTDAENNPRPSALLALAMLVVAPAGCCAYMCYPPWASGALLAAVLVLATCQLVVFSAQRGEAGRSPLAVWIAAGALLAWLGIVVARSECSEFALRQVAWAVAFLAAAVLGAGAGQGRQRRLALYVVAAVGVVLSAIGLAHWLGWNVMEHASYGNRLSAFTNPNRYAVLLTVCWACGAGALVGVWGERWIENRRLKIGLMVAALVLVGACIALTLSRLTLMAASLTAALVSMAWMRLRQADLRKPLETTGLAGLAWRLLPALTLIIALGACFAVGQHALRERAKSLVEADLGQRYRAWEAVWPLLWENPLWGLGPGLFEARFTTVQPLEMQGRWRELHSDWMQLGVEAGFVTLALALALALAWLWDVWRRAKHSYRRDKARAFERLLPAAGIVVALVCSLADFPLREPATAVLVFFLAGMLCQQWPPPKSAPVPLDTEKEAAAVPLWRRAAAWGGALALGAVFLVAAWIPGRNALAYARSPWMGHLFCPEPAAEQADAWRAATATDPSDPELRFHAARALGRVGTPGALAEARADLEAARRLNPYEHRYYWVAGIVEAWAGDSAAAAAFGEEAVRHAPHNLALREWLGRLYATRIPKDVMGESRDAAVAQAMRHLQVAFEGSGRSEIIQFLEQSDFTPAEIGELWPGSVAEAKLHRAEFFLAGHQPHLVDRELRGGPPEEPALNGQYHLLQGALAFRRGDIETGIAEWQAAFKVLPSDVWVKRGPWLAGHLPDLDGPIAAQMVDAFGDQLSRLPAVTEALAWALVRARNWLPANRLLEKSAHQSTSLSAAWAEVALGLKDLPEAESRAGSVQQRDGKAWAAWRTDFERRMEAQRKGAR
ncbi:MAG: O-antigen ligase family protein [Planctomycetota bacterium]|nr:O-antigen ligase family protein [Planctomycetota bacterium]